jgi:hypothetical protein
VQACRANKDPMVQALHMVEVGVGNHRLLVERTACIPNHRPMLFDKFSVVEAGGEVGEGVGVDTWRGGCPIMFMH